jgi:hypothetical protein
VVDMGGKRSINDPITSPTITVELTRPPQTKWEREHRAFQQKLPELLTTHRGKYVAFHDGQLVDIGDDELVLASRVRAKFGYVPIHIGLVADQPRPPERMPSFRIRPLEQSL